jgi:hypothetical protein
MTNKRTIIHVDSSMIDQATYNHEHNTLVVRFKNTKSEYEYHDVPGHLFHGLFSAVSKGKFLYKHVINSPFTYERL